MAKRLCGRKTTTTKMQLWNNVRTRNGEEPVKSLLTTNYSKILLTHPISSRAKLEIVPSFRPWRLLLRGLNVFANCSITKRRTLRVATWLNSTSTAFPQELWLMIYFWLNQMDGLNFLNAKEVSFGSLCLKKLGLSFWDHIHESMEPWMNTMCFIFWQVPPQKISTLNN